MNTLTANDLETKSVSAVEAKLESDEEVIISVRGKDRYVVVTIEQYAKLRECELAVALEEAKLDVEAGRYNSDSITEHLRQVTDEI
jgi:hypothetical protein